MKYALQPRVYQLALILNFKLWLSRTKTFTKYKISHTFGFNTFCTLDTVLSYYLTLAYIIVKQFPQQRQYSYLFLNHYNHGTIWKCCMEDSKYFGETSCWCDLETHPIFNDHCKSSKPYNLVVGVSWILWKLCKSTMSRNEQVKTVALLLMTLASSFGQHVTPVCDRDGRHH